MAALLPACIADPAADCAWQTLFDGRTLAGIDQQTFGGDGAVHVRDGRLVLEPGNPLTGLTFAAALPPCDYEVELIGARELGSDFFCALTFPVAHGCLSLVLGGWGGAVCGLSCLDGDDAARNATRRLHHFAPGREVRIALQVSAAAIVVDLDGAELLRVDPRPHACAVRAELELCQPFGLASYATRAAFAQLRWRPLPARR